MTKRVSRAVAEYAQVLNDLHQRWQPHPGQVGPGTEIFYKDCKNMFIAFGRRAGKTEFAMYCLVRWALTHPNSECYLIGPLQKQMRGIVFSNNRLVNFIPKQYIAKINETEMRIHLTNGSLIKIDGSDNIDSLRGFRMSFLVVDEYKDCQPNLLDAIKPCLVDFDAPLVVLGTPPDTENHYVKLMRIAQSSPNWKFYKLPTSCNPHLPPQKLEQEKAEYLLAGEMETWIREYEAEFIIGGKSSIFPMLTDAHFVDHEELLTKINRSFDKYEWVCAIDPGTASVFAALLMGVNHYTGDIVVFDEVYVTNQNEISTGKVWPVIREKMQQILNVDEEDWYVVVDEAAAWFRVEVLDKFGVSTFPTHKSKNKKEDGVSLIKDILFKQKAQISKKCVKLKWEMRNYVLTDAGKIKKMNDHLIDSFRYGLAGANYSVVPEALPMLREPDPLEQGRMISIEQDLYARNDDTDYLLDD